MDDRIQNPVVLSVVLSFQLVQAAPRYVQFQRVLGAGAAGFGGAGMTGMPLPFRRYVELGVETVNK